MIEYRKWVTRADLKAEPEKLFVFGDNWAMSGFGGQAKEMRDEPNAVGIPTKKFPHMREAAFFTNDDYIVWLERTRWWERLFKHEGMIVWPSDGIGTGLARLKIRAPWIWGAIEYNRKLLEEKA